MVVEQDRQRILKRRLGFIARQAPSVPASQLEPLVVELMQATHDLQWFVIMLLRNGVDPAVVLLSLQDEREVLTSLEEQRRRGRL
jgi:hypothetical protein